MEIKIKQIGSYILWGIATTIINVTSFAALRFLFCPVSLATSIAWLVSVFFAYITNRQFVFHSYANTASQKVKECAAFFAARSFSGICDIMLMSLLITFTTINELVLKLSINVIVVIMNYVLSHLFVFVKKRGCSC